MSESEQNQEQNLEKESSDNKTLESPLPTEKLENITEENKLKEVEEDDDLLSDLNIDNQSPQDKLNDNDANLDDNDSDLLSEDLSNLQLKKENLNEEIKRLEDKKAKLILENEQVQSHLSQMVEQGVKELEQKKQTLEIAVQKLERRRERIEEEMKTTFAGVSQDLAIRVKGFKDYLVGSLQDLAAAAEQLELQTTSSQTWETPVQSQPEVVTDNISPQFTQKSFKQENRQIRDLLNQYRTKPDYYGSPWQLRRTFEPIHAERVSNWFFSQGGRGAVRSMGSRLQNILVASAIMSILYKIYGDRSRTLLLVNTPERLGEWRRGLQDCLGISRSDFGPERGVVLFETPEALAQKADRIIEDKELPLVIIDQTDDQVNLSLLQFPLWLAFAPENPVQTSGYW